MKQEACTEIIKLRVPHSCWERLELWAACERRKTAQLVRNILEDALKARDERADHAA
jgi:hypothetical protein